MTVKVTWNNEGKTESNDGLIQTRTVSVMMLSNSFDERYGSLSFIWKERVMGGSGVIKTKHRGFLLFLLKDIGVLLPVPDIGIPTQTLGIDILSPTSLNLFCCKY